MMENADSPGTYTGSYTVQWGDFEEDAVITGRFASYIGIDSVPVSSSRLVKIDGTAHVAVNPSNDLVPADESARSGLTI